MEKDEQPKNALEALAHCKKETYPVIWKLLQTLATLHVSTSSNERSFSTLRRLKSYLRNSCGQDRLNELTMLNIHRDIEIGVQDIITELAKKAR